MPALELKIDRLHVNISVAAGHEHRISPIVSRAAALLTERLAERWSTSQRSAPASGNLDGIAAEPVGLDVARTSNEQAADEIAGAMLEALALRLGI